MKVCDVISLNPKQATFPFVLSTGWRQSISRLKETAAGVDHDPAGNASRPKRRRPRSVSGKNWNDNRADFRCQSVQVKPFPFHHTEHIRRRPVVAQRSQDSLSKSLQCFKGSCFMGKKKSCIVVVFFPLPVFSIQLGDGTAWCGPLHLTQSLQSPRRSSSVWQLQISPLQFLHQLQPPLSCTSSISSSLGLPTLLGLCPLPGAAQRRANTSRLEPRVGA